MNENDATTCKYIQWLESIQKVMDKSMKSNQGLSYDHDK